LHNAQRSFNLCDTLLQNESTQDESMKTKPTFLIMLAAALTIVCTMLTMAQQTAPRSGASSARPKGPCDIYGAAGAPCVAAHSTTRALYASYNGPLYQVLRQSDGKTMDIGLAPPAAGDAGGYANAAAQDAFCANTYCWITTIYDQSGKHNDLTQAPRGAFSGPAMGGYNNVPVADMAPVTIMGHKVYGAFIEPGMGLRNDDPKGTAVDDQSEGQYWVVNGKHFNSGCCFDYGNAEIDSRDDDNGTMETTYFGDATSWYHGNPPGPWVMTDQENNLVGCVNKDASKLCDSLPNVPWRFVTAMAKGEPHHWTSMGGDAQKGPLNVMFNGQRVNQTYDPMRKQGAILLGNGGDNSNGSQGTFYEGAMTAANTFPTDATDRLVHENVVAAAYGAPRLTLSPASETATPPGLQIFAPGSSQDATLTFTNTASTPATDVRLSLATPAGWTAVASGPATIAGPVAPGASVSATFKVTSAKTAFNGDLKGNARWMAGGKTQSEISAEKVRNVSPVRINEFRIAAAANTTDSFIELFNAGASDVDLSNWSLTEHATQQAIASEVKIPAATKIAPHGFYLLGLSDSGLAVAAHKGDASISVRSVTGMKEGDTISIDTGSASETRKIASLGSPVGVNTTVWQPLPDGPVIDIPVGSSNVPVTSVNQFTVGEKIALGYGATHPAVSRSIEHFEVVTVTEVGKSGTQALLSAEAHAGDTNLKVSNVANISAGDKIRLDIASVGHGIETVTVTKVGTQASRTALIAEAAAGATGIKVRSVNGFAVGAKLNVGTPANIETVTVTALGENPAPPAGGRGGRGGFNPAGVSVDFTPALKKEHVSGETVIDPGTGLDLAAPLKFTHSSNLPFSDRGTGITFQPATAFVHVSNEPVIPLGMGITLDRPLSNDHVIEAAVRDAQDTEAGYQGTPAPNQWFGGPALSPSAGSMVLRDAAGLVVDSLNYGLLVDPWAAQGYQGGAGAGQSGCRVAVPPAGGRGFGRGGPPVDSTTDRSAGRFPDGQDTASNCNDFLLQAAATLEAASTAGATNVKVSAVSEFSPGQTIVIDSGANRESAVIASVGTPGATTIGSATAAGVTTIPVAGAVGFSAGQTITIDSGANMETAVVSAVAGGGRGGGGRGGFGGGSITVAGALTHSHGAGAQVSGSGLTLSAPLKVGHASGAQVSGSVPTPGAPNQYSARR